MSTTETKATLSIQHPHAFFIGGEWVEPSTGDLLSVISPATEEVVMTFAEAHERDVDRAVAAARDAFDNGPWPRLSPAERAAAHAQGRSGARGAAFRARRGVDGAGRRADLVHELRLRPGRGAVRVLRRPDRGLRVRRRAAQPQRRARARRQGAGRRLSRRSRRGTRRSSCSVTRSPRRSPPVAPLLQSRRRRRRSTPISWRSASRRRVSRPASSTSFRQVARSATISSGIRGSTRSRSPAAPLRGGTSPPRRPIG